MSYILSLDQGTTSSRAILYNGQAQPLSQAQHEFEQHFPKPGWVEHDALEILSTQSAVLLQAINEAGIDPSEIAAIGITNQRETTVVWDAETGNPIHNAIVWQDRRTADYCEKLKADGHEELFREKTGLVLDAYFSGTKIKWLLDHVEGARKKAANGKLLFGTIDTWLIWRLTHGKSHATDISNASRTLLFNIHTKDWDQELLDILDIPRSMLPEVKACDADFGLAKIEDTYIPIRGVAGDQQAALFGQQCLTPGEVKNTYGTGCFMLMNTGAEAKASQNGLLTTIAYQLGDKTTYALEGSVFIAGAAIQWLRDGLGIIKDAKETQALAESAAGNDEVIVVPAFAGLGAPYWDMHARGAIFGLTRDSGKAEIVKATLESLAFQTADVLYAMQKDSGMEISSLKVDGGACRNDYLMQFQANLLNTEVLRAKNIESTALGAAMLAGIGSNIWDLGKLKDLNPADAHFTPTWDEKQRDTHYKQWKDAVKRCMSSTQT